jgi:hypothetical protein
MLSKLLFALSLAVSPIASVSAQVEYNDFDTFQTAEKYLADFDYLTENTYRLSVAETIFTSYYAEYDEGNYIFYVFPLYYEVQLPDGEFNVYYSNEKYQVFVPILVPSERDVGIVILNYIGSETEMSFLAIDYIGMNQVIEHDKIEKSNSISIYNSFYKFFTGFFPDNVVTEYHGIFTFVIVAFLLFLIFGFVFFLFRVIRRLVGFK